MKILGIDPGYGRMGWGVISKEGPRLRMEGLGCVETEKSAEPAGRLAMIAEEIRKIVFRYKPEVAAVESLFFFKNQTTAMRVAEARGVVLATLAELGLGIYEYTPLQVKQTLVGYGRAEKAQVEKMVQRAFGIKERIRPNDAADALAVAITHAARERMAGMVEAAR